MMDEGHLLEILGLIPNGIILADEHGRVVYANANALSCLGVNINAIFGKDIVKLFSPIPMQEGKREVILRLKEINKPVRITLARLSNMQWMVVINDITEIHRLQNEILNMDKLASLGGLTAGIAHEIRNPLAGIKATVQALEKELAKHDPRVSYLERIVKEINRLDGLLRSFFDFARPRTPDMRVCDIRDIVEDALVSVKGIARGINIALMQFYSASDSTVYTDPYMVSQVLVNIFVNAIQAVSKEGRVDIHVEDEDKFVIVSVTDTGHGIPENIRGKVFNPFFTTKSDGMGLGLSISYRLMRILKGNITFETSDAGTTFRVSVPKEV